MKFDELDQVMRVFEAAHDYCVIPGIYMVARIDGRNFTRLTKEVHHFEAPFDERMRDCMVGTTAHLMDCGFRAVYGYTQSDEISYLLNKGRERCQVAAGWGLGTGARWLMRSARRGISARPVMRSVM